ncbi:unnamed protein product [Bathycoccus prasinos]|jgi:hypothetical protein|tara:strand:+ start:3812 stop:4405 length:594 start_codon:yes stop_codon:yes gene_type:complete
MLPELNDVIIEEEEEEEEDEFQMLERLTREIDGLAAPSESSLSRDYSSPLREIRAFVGKRNHHHHRENAFLSGGSGGTPSKKNTNSNNNDNGLSSKSEKNLTTTTRDEMMRRKSNRNQQDDEANTLAIVLSKYRALKRAFRKLSEDYDYNFALFKERDEELDLLEEQLKIEKMKTNRYRERVRELEREVALRETATS